ncbi:MAG: LacI family DNA-binding transcriptional regulator [Lachnospiraceae bacterium]|nr:LacI family DNA-binding transcriptional regulator [Lachnospiraceae bacterium]
MSTIRDVAELAQVSIATVSRVLNQDPTYTITEETRSRVIAAAGQLQYTLVPRPKKKSASPDRKSSLRIGCILRITKRGYNDPYYMSVLSGIESYLRECKITLSFIQSAPLLNDPYYLETLFSDPVVGLILMDPLEDSIYHSVRKQVPHIVGIDTLRDDIDDVGYDHLWNGYLATQHLIEKGHRNIGFIGGSGDGDILAHSKRYQGYLLAMQSSKLAIREDWVLDCNWNEDECIAKTNAFCKNSDLPTAIFAASDLLAMAAMKSFYLNKISVPKQIAVIGMSDIEMSQYTNPPLTTFHVPKNEIGQAAARLLLSRIEGYQSLPQKITLPTRFIERNST